MGEAEPKEGFDLYILTYVPNENRTLTFSALELMKALLLCNQPLIMLFEIFIGRS